jgi:hypothetical protein
MALTEFCDTSFASFNGQSPRSSPGWPEFDFRKLPLRDASRKQLAGIYENIRKTGNVPSSKLTLVAEFIIKSAFVPKRGLYLPISDYVGLTGKFPTFSEQLALNGSLFPRAPFPTQFFTNPLLIPSGYGTLTFDENAADSPTMRVSNGGFLIVTIEFDCSSREEFEQNLAWTRGKNDDFRQSAFAQVDTKLREFNDYRGYTIVFSGNRSLHFHFVFSTRHLSKCPWDAHAGLRRGEDQSGHAALMANAHYQYWDRVSEVFSEKLGGNLQPDRKLRSLTQWRRTPWAIRTLEKPSDILDLPVGSRVPQIVIHENIRTRASKTAGSFCVPADFSVAHPIRRTTKSPAIPWKAEADRSAMLEELRFSCESEWGPDPHPIPMEIGRQKDEWIFKFRNHAEDRKPSTFVLGNYRKLHLNGKHTFTKEFYLPDHMTAQETGNHLALRFGQKPLPEIISASTELGSIQETAAPPVSGWEAYCARKREPLQVELGRRLSRGFREPISGDCRELKEIYRRKLDETLTRARDCPLPTLIKSVEGIGKTSALQAIVAGEALQHAMDAQRNKEQGFRHESFGAFAFRSRDQAEKKAKEFCEAGVPTVVVLPFWEHLRIACRELGLAEITREEFDDLTLSSILEEIDPQVYAHLEMQRKNLWSEARFDGGSTLLTMTHRNAELWPTNNNYRPWHHPEFDPAGDPEEHKKLARGIRLLEVVFDDPEADEFVNILPEARYEFLDKRQKQFSGWRNLKLTDRRKVYSGLHKEAKSLGISTFEDFDDLMRLELTSLKPYHVDYEQFKYGQDNPHATASGIYRPKHGHGYYVGLKPWLSQMGDTAPTFLTTEEVVAQTIKKAYGQRLLSLELDNLTGLFPIKVPVFIERRAKSDRVQAEELNVSALAQEILERRIRMPW